MGNWKMNLGPEEAEGLIDSLLAILPDTGERYLSTDLWCFRPR